LDDYAVNSGRVTGDFVDFAGGRYYVIRNVDAMAPFFISVISSSDHWLFASSTGGLTAGRVSPDTALFPYLPVDRVHESVAHTGSRTILRVGQGPERRTWEPFNREQDGRYRLGRNLYKSVLGDKLCFEEINYDLQLAYRYAWTTSAEFGFARQSELVNLAAHDALVELVDGLQNILPAGTPRVTQSAASNLVDAYKWTELCERTGLAIYALYAGISDRAEPCESLRANIVYSLGLERPAVLISSAQLDAFRHGQGVRQEARERGVRGAYFVHTTLRVPPGAPRRWTIVADVEQTQCQVVDRLRRLEDGPALAADLVRSIEAGSDELARLVGAADGFQVAAEENVTVHHYADVLFNIMRGGIFDDQYRVTTKDLLRTLAHANRRVFAAHGESLEALADRIDVRALLADAATRDDPQLERLCYEYLPITFGRRHGDPSRPWNFFTIRLRDENGDRLLSYEGNWRDIFQNWEALTFSYPEFVEQVIAKFVNASTPDGYNPYRITREGIDWEVEEPDDPWSYIGYWGDHQIIYLLKLLEQSRSFHPERLRQLLRRRIFSYANVPYRIRPFADLLADPKSTVVYDHELAARIERRVAAIGSDGRLVPDADGEVYLVNLLEKLLVPLLAKLGNLVVDGGIWLNTQRPEWNDANNALVGHGLSMVTLYYLRRYVRFLQDLLGEESGSFELSDRVAQWLADTAVALERLGPLNGDERVDPRRRFASMRELGEAACRYRQAVYAEPPFGARSTQSVATVRALLDAALPVIDHCIRVNRREDGLYHAYNLLDVRDGEAGVDRLYAMLEGQVAALSSGAIAPGEAVVLTRALFDIDMYRADQQSFMLYPDRPLPGFLEKNRIPDERLDEAPILRRMLETGDGRIVVRDADGRCRFNADITNAGDLDARLEALSGEYGEAIASAGAAIRDVYEQVFNHRAFTGRSGSMFGFEGLGCIYWHMVSKLLLAVQENFFAALDDGVAEDTTRQLASLYYRIRDGLGFNKTPAEYGAFPTDPYSHTPGRGGAQQPGMTGQVKEDVLSRFGELGLRVAQGALRFDPRLLRRREFLARPRRLRYRDVEFAWQDLIVPANALAFTWCQVPIVYRVIDETAPALTVTWGDGGVETLPQTSLPAALSSELFRRTGRVRQIQLNFSPDMLYQE
jgi:hypothetical protein